MSDVLKRAPVQRAVLCYLQKCNEAKLGHIAEALHTPSALVGHALEKLAERGMAERTGWRGWWRIPKDGSEVDKRLVPGVAASATLFRDILGCLGCGVTRVSSIAEAIGKPSAVVSNALYRMSERGLVARTKRRGYWRARQSDAVERLSV